MEELEAQATAEEESYESRVTYLKTTIAHFKNTLQKVQDGVAIQPAQHPTPQQLRLQWRQTRYVSVSGPLPRKLHST